MNNVLSNWNWKCIAVAAMLVVPLAGCDITNRAAGNGSGRAYACDTRPSEPMAVWAGQVYITAATNSACDVMPAVHQVYVYLEEKIGDAWVPAVNKDGDGFASCGNLPPSDGTWLRCEFVYYDCRPGTWRTRVLVTGSGAPPNGTSFSFEPERPETLITSCPDGK